MEFSSYLKSFADADTALGDLARDFISSKSKATTYKGIVKSMEKYHPCDNAWRILEDLYSKYIDLQSNKKEENNKEK